MNQKVALAILLATILFTMGGIWLVAKSQQPPETGLDDFAKCLTAKGGVMYGATWCPHCQKVKADFGASFKYINYVECPLDPKKCLDQGVSSYPTWKFADGAKLEGEESLAKISEVSGCPLPPSK